VTRRRKNEAKRKAAAKPKAKREAAAKPKAKRKVAAKPKRKAAAKPKAGAQSATAFATAATAAGPGDSGEHPPPLIGPGRVLVCEIGDSDSLDRYAFTLGETSTGLIARWKLEGCPDHGSLEVAEHALEASASLIALSQGHVSRRLGGRQTPPFLLSRSSFAALKRGEPVELNVFSANLLFEGAAPAACALSIDGRAASIACLYARAEDGGLWVVDDDTWPVVLRVEVYGGSGHCALVEVGGVRPEGQVERAPRPAHRPPAPAPVRPTE
jgi:hypothetical protein